MSKQISIVFSDKILKQAKKHTTKYGYENLQDFIREAVREKLFGNEEESGKFTYSASGPSLAKDWLSKEEDEAWAYLQKEQ